MAVPTLRPFKVDGLKEMREKSSQNLTVLRNIYETYCIVPEGDTAGLSASSRPLQSGRLSGQELVVSETTNIH